MEDWVCPEDGTRVYDEGRSGRVFFVRPKERSMDWVRRNTSKGVLSHSSEQQRLQNLFFESKPQGSE